MITNVRVQKSKKGEFYAQANFEDMSGSVDMLVFPEAYRRLQEKVKLEIPVLVRGGVRIEEGSNPKLTVSEITPLDQAQPVLPIRYAFVSPWKPPPKLPAMPCSDLCAAGVRLETATGATVDALHSLCRERRGEARVLFDVERQGDFMVVMEAEGYNVHAGS